MNRKTQRLGASERGFALLATGVGLLAIVGVAGITVDLGRMYIAKNELMAYTDAASIAAAVQLDGTPAGITRAQNAGAAMGTGPHAMGWDFASKQITGATYQFAKGLSATPNVADPDTWDSNPPSPADYRFVKVTASANVPLTFMQAFRILQGGGNSATAVTNASSVAAQALITSFPAGLLPFSPIGPDNIPDNFGLTAGRQYTLRYPAGVLRNQDVCAGDSGATYWQSLPAQDRGFWGDNSASVIRGEVVNDTQITAINIGGPVPMVGGAKNTEGTALDARVTEDSDPNSETYVDYTALGTGNGRRIVGVPINGGPPNFTAVGIGMFFLQPTPNYQSIGGNQSICAEYVGPYVEGSMHPGAGATAATGSTGGYIVRLIQ